MPTINRDFSSSTIRIGALLANSQPMPFGDYSGGVIHVPATEGTGVTLTYYVGDSVDQDAATFRVLNDYSGDPVTAVCGDDEAIEIHPAAFGAPYIKLVASAVSAGDYIDYPITLKV